MQIDQFRLLIQKTLKDQRGVTDVAFTPLSHDCEMVSFYEKGQRAHFAIKVGEYDLNPDLIVRHIQPLAASALEAAIDNAAIKRAIEAEEAAAQVKVNG